MKSSSHRRNILDPEWTASGIGVYEARDGRVFVTQVFIEEKSGVLPQRTRRAQGEVIEFYFSKINEKIDSLFLASSVLCVIN